jgi:hypothetical protein
MIQRGRNLSIRPFTDWASPRSVFDLGSRICIYLRNEGAVDSTGAMGRSRERARALPKARDTIKMVVVSNPGRFYPLMSVFGLVSTHDKGKLYCKMDSLDKGRPDVGVVITFVQSGTHLPRTTH